MLFRKNKKKNHKNENKGGLRLRSKFKKTKKKYPLISIVMPNYKSKMLTKAIKSILNQSYKNIELIVIDGDSGKSTINILKKFNNKIDFWISEKDKGMWDAWNKGFKLAKGDFVGIVDSSNILYRNAMEILSKYILNDKKLDFVCGTIKKDGKKVGGFNPEKIHRKFDIIPSSVVSLFIKRNSLKKVGLMNLKYQIQSDYDLLYRMIVKHKLKGTHTRGTEVFGDLGDSGFSKKHNFFKKLLNESQIRLDNKQNIVFIAYIIIGKTLRKLFNLK